MWGPLESLVNNWDVDSYPQLSDLQWIIPIACAFPILRFFLDNYVYDPIGRYFIFKKARALSKAKDKTAEAVTAPLLEKEKEKKGGSKGGDANGAVQDQGSGGGEISVEAIDKDALEKTLIKFKESCWKSLYYTSAFAFAVWVSAGEPWLADVKYVFMGPGDLIWPDQTLKLKLKAMYMYIAGFYMYSIFALIFWETRRKDFVVSMVHHVASEALAVASYVFRFSRMATLVVVIHDTSDIFLELAKVNRYLNIELMASFLFVMFAASWAWLRLWCYPRYVLFASTYVVIQVVDTNEHIVDGPILYYSMNFILILLLVLHIYWWILIVRVLAKQITNAGKVQKDVRSDDEDEDD